MNARSPAAAARISMPSPTVTVVTERRRAAATVPFEVEPAPALRPAGNRNAIRAARSGNDRSPTALPQAPGPTGRRQNATPNRRRPLPTAPDDTEVHMQTM